MPEFSISQVASQFGLRASAVRYYEKIGILPVPARKSGQRRYDSAVLRRLAVIQRARQVGFSLEEIRELFNEFHIGKPGSKRWQQLSQRKFRELESSMERIRSMQALLKRMGNCKCDAVDECGAALLRSLQKAPQAN
jgi:MerR family transcriptional regulator, redox-sensitive transcriptional activator SoxR